MNFIVIIVILIYALHRRNPCLWKKSHVRQAAESLLQSTFSVSMNSFVSSHINWIQHPEHLRILCVLFAEDVVYQFQLTFNVLLTNSVLRKMHKFMCKVVLQGFCQLFGNDLPNMFFSHGSEGTTGHGSVWQHVYSVFFTQALIVRLIGLYYHPSVYCSHIFLPNKATSVLYICYNSLLLRRYIKLR